MFSTLLPTFSSSVFSVSKNPITQPQIVDDLVQGQQIKMLVVAASGESVFREPETLAPGSRYFVGSDPASTTTPPPNITACSALLKSDVQTPSDNLTFKVQLSFGVNYSLLLSPSGVGQSSALSWPQTPSPPPPPPQLVWHSVGLPLNSSQALAAGFGQAALLMRQGDNLFVADNAFDAHAVT